jgi:hypothetical protein
MKTEGLFERLPCLKEWLFLIVAGVLSLLGITLISILVIMIKT